MKTPIPVYIRHHKSFFTNSESIYIMTQIVTQQDSSDILGRLYVLGNTMVGNMDIYGEAYVEDVLSFAVVFKEADKLFKDGKSLQEIAEQLNKQLRGDL